MDELWSLYIEDFDKINEVEDFPFNGMLNEMININIKM